MKRKHTKQPAAQVPAPQPRREVARLARENGAAILLITSDRHSPLAQQADHVLLASNREQRLIEGDHAPSQLSVLLVIEVLYYLMLLGE